MNTLRHTLKVVAVQAPGYGVEQQTRLKNIAMKTGSRVISNELELRYLTPSDLVSAQQVVIDSNRTTIMP